MKNIFKYVLVVVGFISLALGGVGIVLPIIPTTPFFILSYVCFFKGSDKFHNWFTQSKAYSKYVEDFVVRNSLTLKRKLMILLVADILIIFSMLIIRNLYVNIALVTIMIIKVWYFMFKVKTIPEHQNEFEIQHKNIEE
ncbi:MAG: YbaN family protein [Sarcina sp.]